jgi:WD40 repeat protein
MSSGHELVDLTIGGNLSEPLTDQGQNRSKFSTNKKERVQQEDDKLMLEKIPLIKCFSSRLQEQMEFSRKCHGGVSPTLFTAPFDQPVKAIALTQDYKILYLALLDGTIQKFDTKDKTLLKDFGKLHESQVDFICCSKSYFLSCSQSFTIKQHSIADDSELKSYQIHESRITGFATGKNSDKYLFSADSSGKLNAINLETQETKSVPQILKDLPISTLTIMPNSVNLYVGFTDGLVMQVDCSRLEYSIEISDRHKAAIGQMVCTNNNKS